MEGRGRDRCKEFIEEYREECTDNRAADFGFGTATGGHAAKYDCNNNVQTNLTENGGGAVHATAHRRSEQKSANTEANARNCKGNDTGSHQVDAVESCGYLVGTDELVSSTNLGVVEDEPTNNKEYCQEQSKEPSLGVHARINGDQSAVFADDRLMHRRNDVHHGKSHNHYGQVEHGCKNCIEDTQARTDNDGKDEGECQIFGRVVGQCRNGRTHQGCVTKRHIEAALRVDEYRTGCNHCYKNTVVDNVTQVACISRDVLADEVCGNNEDEHAKGNETYVELLVC